MSSLIRPSSAAILCQHGKRRCRQIFELSSINHLVTTIYPGGSYSSGGQCLVGRGGIFLDKRPSVHFNRAVCTKVASKNRQKVQEDFEEHNTDSSSSSLFVSSRILRNQLFDETAYFRKLETYIYRSPGDHDAEGKALNDDGSSSTTTDVSSKTPASIEKDEEREKLDNSKQKNPHLKKQKTPSQVVKELDQHIIGQADAKRAVAIALRNRWRRKQLSPELQKEVTPRNVLMIGPTGCGKTEIARRMAALGGAPFLKVEATKFTEVGYHGGDVDKIIRDLVEVSIILTKKQKRERLKEELVPKVEERLVDLLMTGITPGSKGSELSTSSTSTHSKQRRRARESFYGMLREGILEDVPVELDVPTNRSSQSVFDLETPAPIFTSSGRELGPEEIDRVNHVVAMFIPAQSNVSFFPSGKSGNGGGGGGRSKSARQTMPLREARELLLSLEVERAMQKIDLKKEAIQAVEESGIVFIDEIDKICASREAPKSHSSDASDEGVQRDLLPLVEGTTISTKHGNVKTDFILFIASGAFHAVKPSDMLPELQGRLPIRVNLAGLTEHDLYRILTEPVANLLRQQKELLRTEGVELQFDDDAAKEIAHMAALVNRTVENIGARRLHTVMERIMEDISFNAGVKGTDMKPGSTVTVTKELVQNRLKDVVAQDSDLKRYIL